jgi:hypothetical protein
MDAINCGNKKLVRILLLISSQVCSMPPPTVQELRRAVRSPFTGESSGEDGVHIASETEMRGSPLAYGAIVTVAQKVIPQRRCVQQGLEDRVHETCITKVVQTSQT